MSPVAPSIHLTNATAVPVNRWNQDKRIKRSHHDEPIVDLFSEVLDDSVSVVCPSTPRPVIADDKC